MDSHKQFKMAQRRYENLPLADDTHDDHDDPASSTEVDDSVADDSEKGWMHTQGRRQRSRSERYRARFDACSGIFNTILLLVITGLLAALLWRERPRHIAQVGGDFSGAGPQFDTKMTKWDADYAYVPKNASEFFEQKTIDQWNTMMPAGNGWGQGENLTFFTTSMTHQLHCVFMMARIYAALQPEVNKTLPEDYQSHYLHCVDYLRQAIMCAGDMAMEPHRPTDADDNGPGDGSWAGFHVCKDYSQVKNYLEEEIKDGVRTILPIDD